MRSDLAEVVSMPTTPTQRQWVNADVVAEVLAVKQNTVYRWAREGRIPSYEFESLRRFDLDEVVAWARSCRRSAKKPR